MSRTNDTIVFLDIVTFMLCLHLYKSLHAQYACDVCIRIVNHELTNSLYIIHTCERIKVRQQVEFIAKRYTYTTRRKRVNVTTYESMTYLFKDNSYENNNSLQPTIIIEENKHVTTD